MQELLVFLVLDFSLEVQFLNFPEKFLVRILDGTTFLMDAERPMVMSVCIGTALHAV
jgi:hypothetical protein